MIGVVIAFVLLAGGALRRSQDVVRASLALLVAAGILAFAAVQSGERAETLAEDLAGVSHDRVEEHEESAKFAGLLAEGVGAIAIVGLVVFRGHRRVPGWFAGLVLLLTLLTIVTMARTADLGGQIRHPEIRSGPFGAPTEELDTP